MNGRVRERLRAARDHIPAVLRDFLLAVLMVLAASALAYGLRLLGDRRLSTIFLLPALFAGVAGGLRAGLFAAVLSYLVYDYFVVPPIFSLFAAKMPDAIALAVFATVAVVTGLGSGALREEQRRASERSRIIMTLLETSNFFTITPNEAAIRQRLAEGVAVISGSGAVVTDAEGAVVHRAGQGADWVGGLEGELSSLARLAMRQERGLAGRGRFQARAARAHAAVLGAAVWMGPPSRRRSARDRDEHIALLVELAASAIARCRRELMAKHQAPLQDR
jgi:two-component system sensor histidine kinase KdpD